MTTYYEIEVWSVGRWIVNAASRSRTKEIAKGIGEMIKKELGLKYRMVRIEINRTPEFRVGKKTPKKRERRLSGVMNVVTFYPEYEV